MNMGRRLFRPLARAVAGPVTLVRGGIPFAVPGAPTGVSAVAGNAQATVSFTAPASTGDGPITGSLVTASTGQTATGASSPITVTGLTNGVAVTFTVQAQNAGGYGPSSAASASVTPTAVSLGPELLVDPGFDNPAAWTASGTTSISGSSATGSFDNVSSFVSAPPSGLTNGTTYRCVVVITEISNRDAVLRLGGTFSTDILLSGGAGTYTRDIVAGAGANFVIQGTSASVTTLTVTSASVKQIL